MSSGRFGRLTDRPATLIIDGARVIDPWAGTDEVRPVAVRDGRLVRPEDGAGERIDGSGLVVAPGFCDLHAHLREPGTEGGETIASGSRAAAHGGFTTVCAMPNTDPPLDEPELIRQLTLRAADASCRDRFVGAATRRRRGEVLTHVDALAAAGVVGFSDDGAAVVDDELAETLLERLARVGLPLVEHPEDPSCAGAGLMRAGRTSARLGLPGWPAEAELRTVERDIGLAERTGGRVHLTHLSTAAAVEAVRDAKRRGVAVTADVTPHHLALTDEWVGGARRLAWDDRPDEDATLQLERGFDGTTRVNPPLPTRADALALLAAVEDGTIDAIATDHAPHPIHRKLVPFAEAAPGLIGLETALSIGLAAVEAGRLTLSRLLRALSTTPARIIGEARNLSIGQAADLAAFDPGARWRVTEDALASSSCNTPLLGMEFPGVVRLTIAGGRVTYRS